jgi:hypothetical protein
MSRFSAATDWGLFSLLLVCSCRRHCKGNIFSRELSTAWGSFVFSFPFVPCGVRKRPFAGFSNYPLVVVVPGIRLGRPGIPMFSSLDGPSRSVGKWRRRRQKAHIR